MKPDQRAVLIRLTGRRSAKLTADMSLNSSAASLTVCFFFSHFFKTALNLDTVLDYFCDQTVGAYMQACLRVQLK